MMKILVLTDDRIGTTMAGSALRAWEIARGLARNEVTTLAAVIPVHSHYDHAMDAPEVARRTGAERALLEEWSISRPELVQRSLDVATTNAPKAWRSIDISGSTRMERD